VGGKRGGLGRGEKQTLYAHMNKKKKEDCLTTWP
jgi:hypothetical protein